MVCGSFNDSFVLAGPQTCDGLGSPESKLVLIGVDHYLHPKTFFNDPLAFQATEAYEYLFKQHSTSEFIFPHFQPYKLIYARMLSDLGMIDESLR